MSLVCSEMPSFQNGVLFQHLRSNVDLQTALVALLVFLLVCVLRWQRRYKAKDQVCSDGRLTPPPCISSLPLIGSLPFILGISDIRDPEFGFFQSLSSFCLKKSKEIGNVFGLYISSKYVLVINGRKTIYDALVKKAVAFADKQPIYVEQHYLNPSLKVKCQKAMFVPMVPSGVTELRKLSPIPSRGTRENGDIVTATTRPLSGRLQVAYMNKDFLTSQSGRIHFALRYHSLATMTARQLRSIPYDENFPNRRHLVLTILRDLGYGKREVEVRIQKQVNQFVQTVYEYDGRPFNPLMDVYTSAIGTMLGFLYGRTFDKSHPLALKIKVWSEMMTNVHLFTLGILPVYRHTSACREFIERLIQLDTEMFSVTDALIDDCLTSEQVESFVYKYVKIKGVESAHSDELRYILRDLYFGAADTTLTTLRWILLKIAERRELQDKLHEKVDNHYQDTSRLPTLDDIVRLPLVEATILEVLRLETLMPISITHQTLHDTELHGYFIPKATTVFINLHSAHMDPDEWENPTEFNPERFISEDGTITGKERLITFGYGKRSCLGEQLARQQMFMMLTNILLHFDICPPEGLTRVKYRRVQTVYSMVSDYEIRFIPRRDNELICIEDEIC